MISSAQLLNHLYFKKLPKIYRDMDARLETYPLKRYLSSLIDGGFAPLLKDVNSFLDIVNPERCPEELLPFLCNSFGLPYFEDIDSKYQRKFLANIGEIYKRRGTYSCVKYLTRALTSLDVELSYLRGEYEGQDGRHLIVNLIATSVEQILNMDTSIYVIDRYLRTQIPYYIDVHFTFEIKAQDLENVYYIAEALVSRLKYDLVPEDRRGDISIKYYTASAMSGELKYDLSKE